MECEIKGEKCGFKCTGWDGSDTWAKLHKEVKNIGCETCQDHAIKDMSGLHYYVSLGLGKMAHDPENFKEFAENVACVLKTCQDEKRC